MTRFRAHALTLTLATVLTLAVGASAPAAAVAAPSIPAVPALIGIDARELVSDVFGGFIDLITPDFDKGWVARLVTWLVAVPNVTSPSAYANLNSFRQDLHVVAFGLLTVTFVTSALQLMAAGHVGSGFAAADAFKRAIIAVAVLTAYPTALKYGLQFTNKLTLGIVQHPLVAEGLDVALAGVVLLTAASATATFSLGLVLGAVTVALHFIAKLFVIKVALTAILAVLLISAPLVWAFYPLEQTRWLAGIWTAGVIACLAVPVAWALVFAVAGLVTSDSLLWGDPTGKGDGLTAALQSTVKPFVAIACFWVCNKAPAFLVAAARGAGLNLSGVLPTGSSGLKSTIRTEHTGRGPRSGPLGALNATGQTHIDRFKGLRTHLPGGTVAGARSSATAAAARLVPTTANAAASTATTTAAARVSSAGVPRASNDASKNTPQRIHPAAATHATAPPAQRANGQAADGRAKTGSRRTPQPPQPGGDASASPVRAGAPGSTDTSRSQRLSGTSDTHPGAPWAPWAPPVTPPIAARMHPQRNAADVPRVPRPAPKPSAPASLERPAFGEPIAPPPVSSPGSTRLAAPPRSVSSPAEPALPPVKTTQAAPAAPPLPAPATPEKPPTPPINRQPKR